jgi:DNA-binding transcriptional LysR family regulator
VDLFAAMKLFVRVAERSSFSAVARERNAAQAQVSRAVAQLEKHLGAKLLSRTTRQVILTDEGRLYLEFARRAIAEAEEGEAIVRQGTRQLRGRLRVAISAGFLRYAMFDALASLLRANPELSIDLLLGDQIIDLVSEGADVAIRVGSHIDGSLIARKLTTLSRVVVASRAYLAENAERLPPIVTPQALLDHECLVFTGLRDRRWVFHGEAGTVAIAVSGRLSFSIGEVAREAVLAGLGVSMVPKALVNPLLQTGELVQLLPGYRIDPVEVHAVYPVSRRQVARVELFIEHLLAHFAERTL